MTEAPRAGAPEKTRKGNVNPDYRSCLTDGILGRAVSSRQTFGGTVSPAGFRMIESFESHDFRCFEALKLEVLKTVNVITGANATGKTALLEALAIACRATPEILMSLSAQRGITVGATPPGFPAVIAPQQFPLLWDHWFFFKKRGNDEVSKHQYAERDFKSFTFQYSDSEKTKYFCEISIGTKQGQAPVPVQGGRFRPVVITRKFTAEGKKEATSTAAPACHSHFTATLR